MTPIYDDGRYVVTHDALSTPTRLYPLGHTTARLRRDPLWLALFASALCAGVLAVYGDLLTATETIVFAALPLVLLPMGFGVRILALDAPGHPRAILVLGAGRSRKIFSALRSARLAEIRHSPVILEPEENSVK